MLYIKGVKYQEQFGRDDVILEPDAEFDAYFIDGPLAACLNTGFSREVITQIDRIDVSDRRSTVVQVLLRENIPVRALATGTKNLLVSKYKVWNRKVYGRLGLMGENCFKYLVEAAIDKDIYMLTTIFRDFPEKDVFPAGGAVLFEDTGFIAHNAEEWVDGMLDVGDLGVFEA